MTSQSPRIYTYKITFEEVPYYYYGMHEEKVYDEEYWGSPKTHKWCWELYTPKKQILEIFNSREDADKVERRLIKPVYNTDKWCLNENCGGLFSLDTCSKAGKKGGSISGKITYEMKLGIHGRTKEKMIEDSKKGGGIGGKKSAPKRKEMKVGIFGISLDDRIENGKKGGKIGGEKTKQLGVGICGLTPEQRKENGKKYGSIGGKVGGNKCKEEGLGIFSLTEEQKRDRCKKGGQIMNSQRWICEVTGHITTPAALTRYQRNRGIDISKRRRIS